MLSFTRLKEEVKALKSDEFSISEQKDVEILQEKILSSEDPNDFKDYSSSDILSAFLNAHDYIHGGLTGEQNLKVLLSRVRRVRKRRLL